jgi:hypothetical protein
MVADCQEWKSLPCYTNRTLYSIPLHSIVFHHGTVKRASVNCTHVNIPEKYRVCLKRKANILLYHIIDLGQNNSEL